MIPEIFLGMATSGKFVDYLVVIVTFRGIPRVFACSLGQCVVCGKQVLDAGVRPEILCATPS